MMPDRFAKDLVLLVADKNMEAAFRGLFSRHKALGIRQITVDIFVHPNKDPGCRVESDHFLRNFCRQYRHALVVFDREGCGSDAPEIDIEREIEEILGINGWDNSRAGVIVLDPELEIWLWTKSPHVDVQLGWKDSNPCLRDWLIENNEMDPVTKKPFRPKEAVELALRKVKKPRSSSIYLNLAEKVSLVGHRERAFLKFQSLLTDWFPEEVEYP